MRVGVVGVGGWGKNHLRVLKELEALASFCDVDEEKVRLYSRKYGVNGYTSMEEMLRDERLDAVVIATPTRTHFGLAKRALEKGLHTFVEKPFTGSYELGKKLVSLADERGVILGVGYIERFNPAVRRLKEIVESEVLGRPLLLQFRRENRLPVRIKDVGIILDTSVHDIDTARWLLGEEPREVYARAGGINGKFEEFAAIILNYEGIKTAFITSNWITPKKVRKLVAVFTGGVVDLDFITQEVVIEREGETVIPRMAKEEPLALELRHFLDCVEEGVEPINSGRDCLNTTLIAEIALKSAKEDLPMKVDLKSLGRAGEP